MLDVSNITSNEDTQNNYYEYLKKISKNSKQIEDLHIGNIDDIKEITLDLFENNLKSYSTYEEVFTNQYIYILNDKYLKDNNMEHKEQLHNIGNSHKNIFFDGFNSKSIVVCSPKFIDANILNKYDAYNKLSLKIDALDLCLLEYYSVTLGKNDFMNKLNSYSKFILAQITPIKTSILKKDIDENVINDNINEHKDNNIKITKDIATNIDNKVTNNNKLSYNTANNNIHIVNNTYYNQKSRHNKGINSYNKYTNNNILHNYNKHNAFCINNDKIKAIANTKINLFGINVKYIKAPIWLINICDINTFIKSNWQDNIYNLILNDEDTLKKLINNYILVFKHVKLFNKLFLDLNIEKTIRIRLKDNIIDFCNNNIISYKEFIIGGILLDDRVYVRYIDNISFLSENLLQHKGIKKDNIEKTEEYIENEKDDDNTDSVINEEDNMMEDFINKYKNTF